MRRLKLCWVLLILYGFPRAQTRFGNPIYSYVDVRITLPMGKKDEKLEKCGPYFHTAKEVSDEIWLGEVTEEETETFSVTIYGISIRNTEILVDKRYESEARVKTKYRIGTDERTGVSEYAATIWMGPDDYLESKKCFGK